MNKIEPLLSPEQISNILAKSDAVSTVKVADYETHFNIMFDLDKWASENKESMRFRPDPAPILEDIPTMSPNCLTILSFDSQSEQCRPPQTIYIDNLPKSTLKDDLIKDLVITTKQPKHKKILSLIGFKRNLRNEPTKQYEHH